VAVNELPIESKPQQETPVPDAARELVTHGSTPAAKISLFRSLFCGREDVYARRFESRKAGRAGYQPACANEWVRGVCDKPRIKCADCPNRRFLAVTDEVIRWHLSGHDDQGLNFVMGVYGTVRARISTERRRGQLGRGGKMRQILWSTYGTPMEYLWSVYGTERQRPASNQLPR
jgi:hypothetical protein